VAGLTASLAWLPPAPPLQVVPPGKCAKFPLTFAAFDPKDFQEKVELCVNGAHFVSVEVRAHTCMGLRWLPASSP
jgi:hypothetical protein